MFNKQKYIESKAYERDKYLVQPNSATKICLNCKRTKYTMEFIDCGLFIDGKLPVCTECLRSKTHGDKSRDLINESGITVKCVKCENEKLVGQMSMYYKKNKVLNVCRECNKKRFR